MKKASVYGLTNIELVTQLESLMEQLSIRTYIESDDLNYCGKILAKVTMEQKYLL